MSSENDYLIRKIDSIESKLDSYVVKIEQKLDQIVHIMQAVASLQEKESRNADSIRELKTDMKETVEKFNQTVVRIHERLDKLDELFDQERDHLAGKSALLDGKINQVDEKVSKWMNRGIGIWLAASLFIVILQSVGGLIIRNTMDDFHQLKAQNQTLEKRINETDNNVTTIWNDVRRLSNHSTSPAHK
jgi:peptidoglycan hydrolase CwlO-like protein